MGVEVEDDTNRFLLTGKFKVLTVDELSHWDHQLKNDDMETYYQF